MFLPVDVAAGVIQAPVQVATLSGGDFAVGSGSSLIHADPVLLSTQLARFLAGQLSGTDSLSDPGLLVVLPAIDGSMRG